MYKSLLIHHNNVPDLSIFDQSKAFVSSGNIDDYIHNNIIQEIKSYNFEIIYIKDTLSSNYLEFYGLIMAYHVRLSIELGDKRFVPIVILSDIDGFTLSKLTPLAKILFTKNVFLSENNTKVAKHFKRLNLKKLSKREYEDVFLNHIEITPPQESSHDIANEWSIYRWAEFLQIKDSQKINNNNNKITSMLYFKYLVAKYPIPKKLGVRFIPNAPTFSGKILYIDDEWNNGWQDIFNKYFSKAENITFKTIEDIDKNTKYDQLEKFVDESIASYDPDLIILDMRLTRRDHEEELDEKEISGIKLLKYIKTKINPGIQIIMLTASGKSLILDAANQYDIVGYIKKEHPEDSSVSTKDNFTKLKELIDCGLDKKYLKQVWQLQNDILSLDMFRNDKYNQIKLEVRSIFEILNSSMENKYIYAMLSIFKCIELLNDFYIIEKYNSNEKKILAYWRASDNIKINNHGNKSTGNKIISIIKHFDGFLKVYYINSISCSKDILLHFRIPSFGLMTKMNPCL